MSAVAARLADGRLHLQHGPIDLIIEAFGATDEVERAYGQAVERFGDILPTLVRELVVLREPIGAAYPLLQGPVARRMAEAVWPHRSLFITPMAAVAGAVADEMLQALVRGRTLDKAYVNDGGDIAIHLTPGHELRAGIFAAALDGAARLTYDSPVRGIATSGRGGRSFSLGIADSATVLAATAAAADAAATLVANAVNVEHPAIERRPARTLDPDSDLLDLPVTVAVGPLPAALVEEALDRGAIEARRLRLSGLIDSAALSLQGRWRIDAHPRLEPIETRTPRRLDRSAKRGVERPSLHEKQPIVERRSLRSGRSLPRAKSRGPSVETTDKPGLRRAKADGTVLARVGQDE
jgi:ApbE superfamily uncharacterized protein (UPF0280 family)